MKWLVRQYMDKNHIDNLHVLSDMSGIPYQTLRRRIKLPNTLTVFEMGLLDDVLHFSDTDMLRIARGNYEKSN